MSAFYQLEGEKRGNPACLGGSREVETERGLCAPYHLGQVSLLVALHMYLPCIWTDGLCLPFLIPQGVRPETDVKGEKTGAPGAPVRLLPDGG